MSNAAEAYRKAGFPLSHGLAVQEVADQTDRIIVSRCAQEIGIQLLEENYASKGFGIKAKRCDWGPFAGFAMGHFQYSKFEKGVERFEKQLIAFIPKDRAYFIDDGSYYPFIRPFADRYEVYDNPAIWGKR